MQNLLAELLGTMLLIVLGDGVVANVVLTGTKGEKSGWIVITTGWGIAVAMAAYAVGRISGAHLNPALTARAGDDRELLVGGRAGLHRGADGRRVSRRGHRVAGVSAALRASPTTRTGSWPSSPQVRRSAKPPPTSPPRSSAPRHWSSASWPSPATRRRWCGPTTSICPRCSAAGCSRCSWACWSLA